MISDKTITRLLIALFAAFILADQSLFIVRETQQVLVLQFGKPVEKHTAPGLKVKIPFIHQINVFDKRVLDLDPPPQEVILSDQKRIVVDTFARYKINDMLTFFNTLRTEAQAASRLENTVNSTLRGVMGAAVLPSILSDKRGALMATIRAEVNKAVAEFGIEIVDVRIGRADLPQQTVDSVYARMKTEREREAAEFRAQGQEAAQEIKSRAEKERTVILAEAEKQAQIARGEGDSEAIRTYAEAYGRDPAFYGFYRTLEAYKTALTGDTTTFILKPEGEFFKFLQKSEGP